MRKRTARNEQEQKGTLAEHREVTRVSKAGEKDSSADGVSRITDGYRMVTNGSKSNCIKIPFFMWVCVSWELGIAAGPRCGLSATY